MEVKSALWQKIFISVIAIPFIGVGIACWLAMYLPIFSGPQPSWLEAFLLGLCFFGFGFGMWWQVMKYSIRADNEGITQTNGFFRQTARWAEVTRYYIQLNRRMNDKRCLEPVMFNADGITVFHGFAHILVSTQAIIQQRRDFWQFVEARLEGKKIESPAPDLDPEVLARRALVGDRSNKSLAWQIGRWGLVVGCALLWGAISMGPLYYMVIHNITIPKPWGVLLMVPVFFGPILPFFIRLEIKKRQIARELKENQNHGKQ